MWRILKKPEIELPYNPAIPLLGIHTEETRIERDSCTPIFITALFTIAGTWKQPRCPLADEWIIKLWYIYTMEYSVQFSSVTQSCPTLCNPMNCSTPGLPVHHQLPEELNEYYSAIKRNTFESVPMRWMNLKPIKQSEVSQKENKDVLMHKHGIL